MTKRYKEEMNNKLIKTLLVEDNPGDVRLLQRAMARVAAPRFELEHVDRLNEALKRLDEEHFDAVLLDLSLPDEQGLDTLVRLLAHASIVPIVVLTNNDDEALAVEAVRKGAQDYLIKGHVESNLLVRAIKYAIERKLIEEQLIKENKEKEILLKEVHHRVKNNLQVISSILNLQSRKIMDKQAVEMFKESQNRIKSMALIHEKLYQSGDLTNIDFSEYILSLTEKLFGSFGVDREVISLNMNTEEILLGLDTAISCGLILNELLSNAIKHAFPGGKKGKINIRLRSIDENRSVLTIHDNGVGFPDNLDFRNTPSLGLELVNMLVEQLEGAIELEKNGGTTFRITFSPRRHLVPEA